jgi:hypothetical protein
MQAELFHELLGLLHDEQLLRLSRRAQNRGQLAMAEILYDEFKKRDDAERREAVRAA